jgi:signal peptidase complex subunit 3
VQLRRENKPYISGEVARIVFDMNADLRPVFNWNVRMLYAWITVEYTKPSSVFNQFVIWDARVENADEALFELRRQHAKYDLVDADLELRGIELTLTLRWDIIPYVGIIKNSGGLDNNSAKLRVVQQYKRA